MLLIFNTFLIRKNSLFGFLHKANKFAFDSLNISFCILLQPIEFKGIYSNFKKIFALFAFSAPLKNFAKNLKTDVFLFKIGNFHLSNTQQLLLRFVI